MFNGVQLNELRECTVSGKHTVHTVVKCINNEVKKKKNNQQKKTEHIF